jgi:hypothetical protein
VSYRNAFEMSPVPAPGPDAVPPEPFRGSYGMPALGDALDAVVAPGSPEANQLVERHRAVFASYFPLTRQMQVCLGRRFAADPAFAAH